MGVDRSAIGGGLLRGLLVMIALALPAAPASAAPALHVIPFPGTPDASSLSHIIFSSLKPSDLTSVIVAGSSSGPHKGHTAKLPDDAGTAFLSDTPFTPGEHVSVTAMLSSPAAGTASGDPGATVIRFSFTIAVPPSATAAPARADGRSGVNWPGALSTSTSAPSQSFHSAPGLYPPIVTATSDPDHSAGDIFLTAHTPPSNQQIQNGPMILDSSGHLVWFRPVKGYATNLEVQRYQGQPVLTWFQWTGGSAVDIKDVITDRSYRTVATLRASEGYVPDLHEFQLTSEGTAFIDAYKPVRADLSGIGGSSNGPVMDCLIQELDIKTGQLLWEWHALGHVPVSASYYGHPSSSAPYEYFHLNSIQQLPNGNLLISARNTWAVYEINKQTGHVVWTLGGRYSNFKMGPGTNFEWQHDARLAGDTMSLFDDGALPQEERQSSAKVLRLDTASMTASLVRRYTHSPPVLTGVEGSTQVLPNHNVFVGWGEQPLFSEYTAAGKQIFAGSLPLGTNSYRAYRFQWHAQPLTRPSLAVLPQHNGSVNVYVSWNGATQVAAWRVRGGAGPGALKALANARRTDFETTIVLPSAPSYLAVAALNAQGKVIGTSRVRKL